MFRIIGGILVIGFGILMVIKSEGFLQNFGTVAWAEEHMAGSGGSRMFYKLFGAGLTLLGVLIATNLIGELLLEPFGSMFIR